MMTHDESLQTELLDRYLANACSPEERRVVEAWIAVDPDRRSLRRITAGNGKARQWNSAQAFAAVLARGEEMSRKPDIARGAVIPASARPRSSRWIWSGTAAVVLGITAFWVVPDLRDIIGSPKEAPEVSYVAHRTARGERSRIPLPDGSVVVLAPESRLQYARSFSSRSRREISLEGQALFTVTHSAGAPFIVRTGNVATTVLGTSFGVRRYPADTVVEVAVAQGKVGVAAGTASPSVLGTGDIARVSDARGVAVSRGNVMTPYLVWTEGQLHFTGQRFGDVVADLERWYGVQVIVKDPVLRRRTLVTTLGPESFREAMELVALSLGAHADVDGRRVTFRLSTIPGSL